MTDSFAVGFEGLPVLQCKLRFLKVDLLVHVSFPTFPLPFILRLCLCFGLPLHIFRSISTSGALVPLILKRLGADPAIASSIFLTTVTDVVSMGMLLALAAVLVK